MNHSARVPLDDGGPISFRWHFKRGILQERMSGYELGLFLLREMPHVLKFFSGQPRIYGEFKAMMTMLATSPKAAVDRLLPWIRSVTRQEEDDVILLSLFDQTPHPSGPIYFEVLK